MTSNKDSRFIVPAEIEFHKVGFMLLRDALKTMSNIYGKTLNRNSVKVKKKIVFSKKLHQRRLTVS